MPRPFCNISKTMYHIYNVSKAAGLYRHFDRRKTLAQMEEEHPSGADWNAQFRFPFK